MSPYLKVVGVFRGHGKKDVGLVVTLGSVQVYVGEPKNTNKIKGVVHSSTSPYGETTGGMERHDPSSSTANGTDVQTRGPDRQRRRLLRSSPPTFRGLRPTLDRKTVLL